MRYPLENLNDEKFQQLCQALLARSNPGTQCFPVGQPDGGRDAVVRDVHSGSGRILVYQVKFVRNPNAIQNPREWLIDIIAEEIEKVRALVDRSAIGYFLLTNVSGSAHLDVGSIDKLNTLLQEKLGLPSMCWWRDDLERRLDDAWSIKWAYPEIMTGPDFLRAIFESGIHADTTRRETVLRAFLRDQFSKDADVRFRQIDLQNKLLDLFIDVPIAPARPLRQNAEIAFRGICRSIVQAEGHATNRQRNFIEHGFFSVDSVYGFVGAASFLLYSSDETPFRNIVLEGAPGQGKSTITQYVCQVHRCRLLQEIADIEAISPAHRVSSIRLPFRVDLRDFALWMSEENPFTRGDRKNFPAPWQGTLEAFLAALISYHAGGLAFSIEDLVAVMRVSAVSVFLDGLDEVASSNSRQTVIDEVVEATQRLAQNAASLQVIVTSRPAAFLNSPGMPEGKFVYCNLRSLEQEHVTQYFELWARARGLNAEVKDELLEFINAKLDQPHIRELARNAMQLAILLSLLYTKGAALPEKRTALYDAYIEHFFGREAEKTVSVRKHRDLLLELHRFLGWKMHSEAERNGGRGGFSTTQLLSVVEEYLTREGRDPGLAKQLFEGMERVVVLVSRAQGSIEFEVQPVREYFAARHLFETAPLSTPGNEQPGSRPDRFEVIARKSYWLNVARFYAGCYSKGEIPSLLHSLRALGSDSELGLTNHPRQLALALLSDWVFAQIPSVLDDVINLITHSKGFLRLLAGLYEDRYSSAPASPLALSEACGGMQLSVKCFDLLEKQRSTDYSYLLISVLRANLAINEGVYGEWLRRIRAANESSFARWLTIGRGIGALKVAEVPDLATLPLTNSQQHVDELYWAGRLDILEQDQDKFETAIRMIADADLDWPGAQWTRSPLSYLVWILRPELYAYAIDSRQPTSLVNAFAHWIPDRSEMAKGIDEGKYPAYAEVSKIFLSQIDLPVKTWATSLVPWSAVLEPLIALWGETRAIRLVAIIAAGAKTGGKRKASVTSIFNMGTSICERVRYARLRAREPAFFVEQFEIATSHEERIFLLLVAFSWCPVSTIVVLLERISSALDSLSEADWIWTYTRAQRMRSNCAGRARDRGLTPDLLPATLGYRAACIFADLVDKELRAHVVGKYLGESGPGDRFVQSHRLEFLLRGLSAHTSAANQIDLAAVSRAYSAGGSIESLEPRTSRERRALKGLWEAQRREILLDPSGFPAALVHLVELRFRSKVSSRQAAVAATAEEQGWFSPA